MVCCALMTAKDLGTKNIMRFDIPGQKPAFSQGILSKTWEVGCGGTAVAAMERLSQANEHNPVISEITAHIIAGNQYEIVRGIFTPIRPDDLLALDLPRNFKNFWKSVTNNANEDLKAFMDYLEQPEEALRGSTFHNITVSVVTSRLNKYVKGYETALRALGVFGYSADELTPVQNFAALDLGRVGHVARLAAHAGYITDEAAWKYMQAAGDTAYRTYDSWRQFLAAYLIGRGMAEGANDLGDFGEIVRYLLRDKKSPYRLHPLKSS